MPRGVLGRALGRVAEPLYRVAINRVNRQYDAGKGVTRLPIPVVSVGNLSVGGTGKTPLVAAVTRELMTRGRRVCIAMRGYAKGAGGAGRAGGETRSDEEDVYHRLLPGVAVVAQPDRTAGIQALLSKARGASETSKAIDAVVLDDGFQHRRLARDFDIVLIDLSRDPFSDRLLPAGWLREPTASLARADAVVLTHAELVGAERVERMIAAVRGAMRGGGRETSGTSGAAGLRPIAVCRHEWTSLRVGDESCEVEWLRGKRAVVTCAIGNPAGFLAAARRHGAEVAGSLVLRDHDPFAPGTLERLSKLIREIGPEVVLTTEKDWSKLRLAGGAWAGGVPVARPQLELVFERGWEELVGAMWGAIGRHGM